NSDEVGLPRGHLGGLLVRRQAVGPEVEELDGVASLFERGAEVGQAERYAEEATAELRVDQGDPAVAAHAASRSSVTGEPTCRAKRSAALPWFRARPIRP